MEINKFINQLIKFKTQKLKTMLVVNICQEEIKWKKNKNGKHYATLTIDKRKEPDQYENTHSVSNSQSKEERAEKKKKEYCGNGKEYVFNKQESEDTMPF